MFTRGSFWSAVWNFPLLGCCIYYPELKVELFHLLGDEGSLVETTWWPFSGASHEKASVHKCSLAHNS